MSLFENACEGLVCFMDIVNVSSEAVDHLLNVVSGIESAVLKSQLIRVSVILKGLIVFAKDLLIFLRFAKLNLLVVSKIV